MEAKKVYAAVASVGIFFLILRLVFKVEWATYAGLGVLGACIIIPPLAVIIAKGWYALAEILGRINSFVLMTVLFWLVVTPIGFLYRIVKKEVKNPTSTFKTVNKTYTTTDFDNPW